VIVTLPGVSMRRVCRVLKFSRARLRARAVIVAAPPRLDEVLAERIQRLIEAHPTFGYRRLCDMWGLRRHIRDELVHITNDLVARIQRLEGEQAEIRAWFERERQLRVFTANLAAATQVAPAVGAAIERFAEAMRAPLRRGRVGGLARARTAWRFFDGT